MLKLVIIRGNSGSGKSTVAELVRNQVGLGTALINQDYIRRTLLKDKSEDHAPTVFLLDQIVRACLNQGFNVILEGVLSGKRYQPMLKKLVEDFSDNHVYYLDISFDETLKRHAGKPIAGEVGEHKLREWYIEHDVMGVRGEVVIPESSSQAETVTQILQETRLSVF